MRQRFENDVNSLERLEPCDDHHNLPTPDVPPICQQSRPNEDLEHEFVSVRDCLLKCSFYHSEFDSEKFLVMAETMMDKVFAHSDDKTTNKVKADIITSLVRKMSTLLSLTKSQNEQLLTFWKAMMVFVHPPSMSIVKKVFASYSTCVRQSLRDEHEKTGLCQRYMDECSFFAIAIDSTLIRNEHLYSCFARFSFDGHIIQIPLFFDT